jgi:phospholipase/carboxylesterase
MDRTMPMQHSERAFECLAALGADVRLDVVPRAVHQLAPPLLDRVWEILSTSFEARNMAS